MKPIIRSIVALLLCLSYLTSNGQNKAKLSPIDYNDFLSSSTDSLNALGAEWGAVFAEAYQGNRDFTKLKTKRQKLTTFIVLRKHEIETMTTVGVGGEGIKQAILSFLDFEMTMLEKSFLPLEDMNSNTSDEEINAAITKLTNDSKSEEAVLDMVRSAQIAYAKQNNFTIEDTE